MRLQAEHLDQTPSDGYQTVLAWPADRDLTGTPGSDYGGRIVLIDEWFASAPAGR
jgi:hypothetical protein